MGRFVNDATGAIVSVADEKDYRFASGWHPAGSTPKRSDAPDESWTNAQLKAYADEHAIDLGDAKNKAGFLAAIAAGPTEGNGEDGEESDEDESDDSPDN